MQVYLHICSFGSFFVQASFVETLVICTYVLILTAKTPMPMQLERALAENKLVSELSP